MFAVVRRHPHFRTLWLAQVVSAAGDWLNRVALLTLIGRLSAGEAALGMGALFGLELALRLLPTAAFGPLAGPVADRLPRKTLLIVSDLLRAVIVLGFLAVDEARELPWLYSLLVAQMGVGIFFNAARSAALPNTVPAGDLHAAYALSAATWSAMLTLGALAGGLLTGWIGVQGVFLADALTYLASALILSRLVLPPTPRQPEAFSWRGILLLEDMRRAWRHVRTRGVAPMILAKTFWGPAGGFLVLLSVAARDRFAGEAAAEVAAGAAGYATGALYSGRGLGTGLGPILAQRWSGSGDATLRRQVTGGFLLAAAGYAAFAVAGSLTAAFFFVALAHCGGSTLWVASTTCWQRRVDDAFRGRAFTLEFLGMTLAFTAGGLAAGGVYDLTGSVRDTTWAVCALVVASGLIWAACARRMPLLDGPAPKTPAPSPPRSP